MGYCSSAMDAKDNVHERVKLILKDAGLPGDAVVLTGGDGVMMKSWLIDLFAGKSTSMECDIV